MAIHPPGETFRHSRILRHKKAKRTVVAILSLTAMVDMFTVLVIFLLQNYSSTGQVIYIPKEVVLPKAEKIEELKPSLVVTISNKEILLDKDSVISFDDVQKQPDWLVKPLYEKISTALQTLKIENDKNLKKKLQDAVDAARGEKEPESDDWSKVTVQADKSVSYLVIKKILYTITEAGAGQINFAVMKNVQTTTK